MKRKIFLRTVCLCLCLALTLGAVSGCARKKADVTFELPTRMLTEEGGTYGYYDYLLYDDGTAALTAYAGDETAVTIPAKIDSHAVVTLGDELFTEKAALSSVTIPDSVETIGIGCFWGCTSLSSIRFGKGVWNIASFAFEDTPWLAAQKDEFVLVNDVLLAYHGEETRVIVPDSVHHIAASAFSMQSDIVSVALPDRVFTIGEQAFAYCGSLVGVSFGSALLTLGQSAFGGCEKLTAVDFPATLRSIGPNAFSDCYELRYACLGSSLTELGDAAFDYCQRMTVICIPATLEVLHSTVFSNCYSLALVLYGGSSERFAEVAVNDDNYVYDWTRLQILYDCAG